MGATCFKFCDFFLSFFLSIIFGMDRSVLALITSLIGVVGVTFMSRGFVFANEIYIVFYCVLVSISSRYYGEATIYGALMLPIHIFCLCRGKTYVGR